MFKILPDSRKKYYRQNALARRLRMKPPQETKDDTRARLLDILINLLNRLRDLGLSVEYKPMHNGFSITVVGSKLVPIGDIQNTDKVVK